LAAATRTSNSLSLSGSEAGAIERRGDAEFLLGPEWHELYAQLTRQLLVDELQLLLDRLGETAAQVDALDLGGPCLRRLGEAAVIGAQFGKIARHRQRGAVFVEQTEVHRQVRPQFARPESIERQLEGDFFLDGARQRLTSGSSRIASSACSMSQNSPAKASSGCTRCRYFCGSVFSSATTFPLSSPGTSHSMCISGTRLSAASGSESVTPSSAAPGSCL
jgi:hypothetical protein